MKKEIMLLLLFNLLFFSSEIFCANEEFKLAMEYISSGRYVEAIEILENLTVKLPGAVEIKFNLAIAYVHVGNYEKAESFFLDVLSKSPDFLPPHYYLAMLYEEKKQFINAKKEWMKVLSLTKDETLKQLSLKHIEQINYKISENEKK